MIINSKTNSSSSKELNLLQIENHTDAVKVINWDIFLSTIKGRYNPSVWNRCYLSQSNLTFWVNIQSCLNQTPSGNSWACQLQNHWSSKLEQIFQKKSRETKWNRRRPENFDIFFCVVFTAFTKALFLKNWTEYKAISLYRFEVFLRFLDCLSLKSFSNSFYSSHTKIVILNIRFCYICDGSSLY